MTVGSRRGRGSRRRRRRRCRCNRSSRAEPLTCRSSQWSARRLPPRAFSAVTSARSAACSRSRRQAVDDRLAFAVWMSVRSTSVKETVPPSVSVLDERWRPLGDGMRAAPSAAMIGLSLRAGDGDGDGLRGAAAVIVGDHNGVGLDDGLAEGEEVEGVVGDGEAEGDRAAEPVLSVTVPVVSAPSCTPSALVDDRNVAFAVWMSVRSTSVKLSVPAAVSALDELMVAASSVMACGPEPSAARAGPSLLPVTVMVTCLVELAPMLSVTVRS